MSRFYLVWDVMMTGEAITSKKEVALAEQMQEHASGFEVQTVQRWNHVADGKKTTAAGFTTGLRFTFPLASTSDAAQAIAHLSAFESGISSSSTCRVAESISFPLDRSIKQRLPALGQVVLQTRFTHGLGQTSHKAIQNAKSDQTRMTKHALDPTNTGKNSSASWFTDEFRALLSNPSWFLVIPTHGESPSSMLKTGAEGGVYEPSYNFHAAIEDLTSASEGHWWSELSDDAAHSMRPTLMFDPTEQLSCPYDPSTFTQFQSTSERINAVLEHEEAQTGDPSLMESLQYDLERISRGRRIVRQATSDDGLVSGMERFVVKSKFIQPFITEEFFNALGFFLMARYPKFWRNGESEVLLFHTSESLELIEERW